jgi:phosphoribosyl-dephospho-CoA transferase
MAFGNIYPPCSYASLKQLVTSFCVAPPSVGTSARTRDVVLDGMKKVQEAFREHDLTANVRLETYEVERYYHVPPTKY